MSHPETAAPGVIRVRLLFEAAMSHGRVVSLSVHKNTARRRQSRVVREAAMHAAREVVNDHGEAEGFVVIAMSRDGRYTVQSGLPDGSPKALWMSMIGEAAHQATE